MLSTVLVVLAIFLFLLVIWLISYYSMKRKRKAYIHEKFGKIPKIREWNDAVKNYYDVVNDGTGLDNITWNDLSMNDVFQRIAQCDTSPGEEILYWRLRRNRMSPEEQQIFEERVRTWADNEKEREKIEELLCDIGKSDSSYYLPAYLDGIESYIFGYQWVYRLLQILLVASLVFIPFYQVDWSLMPFVGMCAVNLGLYFRINMKHDLELSLIGTAVSLLGNAKQMAARKEIRESFPELQSALAGLRGVIRGEKILRIKREGARTQDALGTCLDYLMGITLMQITTYNKVMKRLMNNVENYLTVYRCIGELDVAISTASFRKSLPWCCIPEYTDEKRLDMTEVYHPLIKDPVANDFAIEKSCLITGSNASGKSTFIKAVAVNAVLAQAINTCAAKRFEMPSAEVITSMAVRDDLMAGESYFIREIRYLKRILDSITEERVTICAIDEILRGTNTGERIRASRAILEYLRDKNCIALVATHDKELTELLGDDYLNYHFSEEIGKDDIAFSYKILEGPATSQNAVKLLEFAGFPEEIIEAAQE